MQKRIKTNHALRNELIAKGHIDPAPRNWRELAAWYRKRGFHAAADAAMEMLFQQRRHLNV
jgi:hypothetical protein